MIKRGLLLLSLLFFSASSFSGDFQGVGVAEPGAELWHQLRDRTPTDQALAEQLKSKMAITNTAAINDAGQLWRQFRIEEILPAGGRALLGILLALAAFRIVRGRIKLKGGRSGKTVKRFSNWQRFVHWWVAITFVTLGITGVAIMFGRVVLMPWLGADIGGTVMYASRRAHDFVGPVFGVGMVLMIVTFMKGNFPSLKTDLIWLLKGGGLFGGHAPAGRYNAGEKVWYWLASIFGLVVIATGLILDFPIFEQTRNQMMLSLTVHGLLALVLVGVSMGHIYIGTVGMEGAFEAMATGLCDTQWAKEHHDLWYEELVAKGEIEPIEQQKT